MKEKETKLKTLKVKDSKKPIVPELIFEDTSDFIRYIAKIKDDGENYILTLYKKGKIMKRFRRIDTPENGNKNVMYREIV